MRVQAGLSIVAVGTALSIASCSGRPTEQSVERVGTVSQAVTWANVSNTMQVGRYQHAAASLGNGRALVCGGRSTNASTYELTCDIFTLGTNSFSNAAAMASARALLTLTPTGTGAVLAIGGLNPTALTAVVPYTYDALGGSWGTVTNITTARYGHTTTRFNDGNLLVAGGLPDAGALSNERRVGAAWSSAGALHRYNHTATLLSGSASVLLVGGRDITSDDSANNVYTYASGGTSLTAKASLPVAREGHTATLLPDGSVLVAGGQTKTGGTTTQLNTAVRYYPDPIDSWHNAGTFTKARAFHQAVLVEGKVVIAGGHNTTDLALAEVAVYNPATNTWTDLDPMAAQRYEFQLTELDARTFLASGGRGDAAGGLNTGEVFAPRLLGEACDDSKKECVSGFCVDGVCCDTLCAGQCQACDVPSSLGTCTNLTEEAPHGSRPACSNGYLCASGACATSCSDDDQCADSHYCEGVACAEKKGLGDACDGDNECANDTCVDGYCCNDTCSGKCEACDVGGQLGTCVAVVGAPHGSRGACGGVGAGTECGMTCDGANTDACVFPSASTSCGVDSCSSGQETHTSTCDGAGACSDVPTSCGAYACNAGGSACLTSCSVKADCAVGNYCEGGACAPIPGLGTPCDSADECVSEFCTDGVCCVGTCDEGSSCALTGDGLCSKEDGTECDDDEECGSGHCVDGVCCDSECEGQCEACDVKGKVGSCSPVSGEPHGDRPACDEGDELCGARTCDGAEDTSSCVGYLYGTDTECAPAACDGDDFTPAAACDGRGACKVPDQTSCLPYTCADSGCLTACESDDECAQGYRCENETCAAVTARCSDESTSVSADGVPQDCTPYLCTTEGACSDSCTSTVDCASGFVCDAPSSKCVTPETFGSQGGGSSKDSGGCRVGAPRGNGAAAWFVLGAAALAWSRRRRATLSR